MNLIMIGFMGTGKTTIGKKLARRLGYFFLDMDLFIEKEQNCSVSEIFEQYGEEHFRKLETSLLKRLMSVDNTIISTGGGVVGTNGNLDIMKQLGTTVYLSTPFEDILERITRSQHRPLARAENLEEKMTALLNKRSPLYEQADQIVETKGLTPWHITSQIIQNV